MLKEVMDFVKKQDSLSLKYGITVADRGYYNNKISVLITNLYKFMEVSKGREVNFYDAPGEVYPVEAKFEVTKNGQEFEFIITMTHLNYLEYKKSRAKNTTKEKQIV